MERVFGIDVHKNVLVTTVITEEGEETKWSGIGAGDLKNLMEWLKEKKMPERRNGILRHILGSNIRGANGQRVPSDSGKRSPS